jgi:hypothetical protein
VGAALGGLGWAALSGVPPFVRLIALAALVGAGVVLEAGWLGVSLPTVRRQVNEQWLHAYRGWVYGLGFGAQLGAGVATIVTTAGVYAALAAEALAAEPGTGALIGAVFGASRGAAQLAGAGIRSPQALVSLDSLLRRAERPAALAGHGAQLLVAAGCLSVVVR